MDHQFLPLLVLGALLLFVAKILVGFLTDSWWRRNSVVKMMAKQGIYGPPYNILDGHYREIKEMEKEAASKDMATISHDFIPRIFPFHDKNAKIYGKPLLYWWGKDPMIYVTEPSLVTEILSTKFGFYHKPEQVTKAMEFLFGKGLLLSSGEEWVVRRRIVNGSFHQEKIKGLLDVAESCANNLRQKWEDRIKGLELDSAEIEVHNGLVEATADVILKCLFGEEGYEKGRQFLELQRELLKNAASASMYQRFIPSFVPSRKTQIVKQIDKCLKEIVEECRENAEKGKIRDEILATMLQTAGKDRMSNKEAADECKTLVFAGHETIGQVITWTMMLLGIHLDWQNRAFEEVQSVMQGRDFSDPEALNRLKIVSMIINESLRLYSPAVHTARQATKDLRLGNMFIPKGLCLGVNVLQVHRDTDTWGPDALSFNPSRFALGVSKACKSPLGGYIPFLMGPRVCVGQAFAIHEAKIFLASFLLRFKWHISPNYRHSPFLNLSLQPQHGVQLIMSLRTSSS